MGLTPLQLVKFKDTCNLWKPYIPDTDTGDGSANDVRYRKANATPIPCLFSSTPEADNKSELGRTMLVNIMTMDRIKFNEDVEVQDGWIFQLTTTGHGDTGAYWYIQGNPQTRHQFAREQMVYGKRTDIDPSLLEPYGD